MCEIVLSWFLCIYSSICFVLTCSSVPPHTSVLCLFQHTTPYFCPLPVPAYHPILLSFTCSSIPPHTSVLYLFQHTTPYFSPLPVPAYHPILLLFASISECPRQCMNGGVLDEEECSCNCSSAIDYSGVECEGVYSSYSGHILEIIQKRASGSESTSICA